jgi:hypothetical protein
MSAPDTREKFHAALGAYNQAAAEAVASGQDVSPAELAETTGLTEAARAHVRAARPLEEIKAEYEAMQALADELSPVRRAVEILRGNYPGTGHTATAGIGT